MAENLGEARLRLTADARQLESKLKSVSAKTRQLGLGFLAVGAAVGAPLAAGVKVFAEYEQAMAKVQAVSGATEEEFRELDEVAKRMGHTTVFTARESAQALSFMSMAGLEARESIAALPAVLNLAAAGQLELGQSADIVTNVMAGYGIAAEDVTRAVDVLTVGFTSANTDLAQLGDAFKLGGPVAKAAGLRFEETAAALSLMGNAGFQATLSGTALRGAIVRMINPTDEALDILGKYGVEVVDTAGKMRPLVDIMRQFEEQGLTASDAMAPLWPAGRPRHARAAFAGERRPGRVDGGYGRRRRDGAAHRGCPVGHPARATDVAQVRRRGRGTERREHPYAAAP